MIYQVYIINLIVGICITAKVKEKEGSIVKIAVIAFNIEDIVEHRRNIIPVTTRYWGGFMTEQ